MKEQHSLSGRIRENPILAQQLPYERFQRSGPGSLSDAELLAILIRTGTTRHTPVEIGQMILQQECGGKNGLSGLFDLTMDELTDLDGIGEVKAIRILCVTELARRLSQSLARNQLSFKNPRSVADYYMEQLCHESREQLLLLSLDTRLNLIREEVLTIGTVNTSLASVREIFQRALKAHAVSMMLIHNHPSGDPTPSAEDLALTDQVRRAGELMEIQLLDHIIIGDHCYISMNQFCSKF